MMKYQKICFLNELIDMSFDFINKFIFYCIKVNIHVLGKLLHGRTVNEANKRQDLMIMAGDYC